MDRNRFYDEWLDRLQFWLSGHDIELANLTEASRSNERRITALESQLTKEETK